MKKLQKLVWEKSKVQIGKLLNCSDNAVKKYCQNNNIIMPPMGYWALFYNGNLERCDFIKKRMLNM